MTSLLLLCETGMTMLTEEQEQFLGGRHPWAASDMRHGTRWMFWYQAAGCHRNTPLRCVTVCSCWLRHVTAFHAHRLKVISGCITQAFQWSPGRATNLWVRLSHTEIYNANHSPKMTWSVVMHASVMSQRLKNCSATAAVRTFSSPHCI